MAFYTFLYFNEASIIIFFIFKESYRQLISPIKKKNTYIETKVLKNFFFQSTLLCALLKCLDRFSGSVCAEQRRWVECVCEPEERHSYSRPHLLSLPFISGRTDAAHNMQLQPT